MARTKYVLIERPECHPTAVSKVVLADMIARGETVTAQRPVTQAEIKRDRIHVYHDDWYFERVAWDDLRTQYHGKRFQARIAWFDHTRGLGMAVVDGHAWPIYACNIAGRKTWYPETACVYYDKGQEVEVEIEIIGRRIFVKGITPGHLDQEGWDRIKDQNLAFRCDEDGNAINGLFA